MTDIPFRVDPDPTLEKSEMTPVECFTTDDKSELNHTHFATEDEKLLVGTWECAPCREDIPAYTVNELMTIVSGRIRLTHADGKVEELGPGDSFFIAKGTPVVWEITETLRKIYMIVE